VTLGVEYALGFKAAGWEDVRRGNKEVRRLGGARSIRRNVIDLFIVTDFGARSMGAVNYSLSCTFGFFHS
jgi:hypothetical protein